MPVAVIIVAANADINRPHLHGEKKPVG